MNPEDTGKETMYTPTHKVGIKLMNGEQLKNIFPNYESLRNKIKIHREAVAKLQTGAKKHYQYNLMYDNVFSILGKRGTGKTSAAFTLQNMIEKDAEYPYDKVLPIIIPEVIPKDCSALGWILAIVKEEIQELERALYPSAAAEGGDPFWSNCRYGEDRKQAGRLAEKVDRLIELCFAGKYNPSSESSFYRVIGNSARQAENYYRFAKEIANLWDEWVAAITRLHRKRFPGEDGRICPLIYFLFDDVDLAPEKVEELLSIIIKYLSHPNIIVITTADEELFLEVIENNLDKNLGRLPKEWRSFLNKASGREVVKTDQGLDLMEQETDLISQTARMYLGKVMPTSTRYYLKLFTSAEQKMQFGMDKGQTLGEALAAQIDHLLDYPGAINESEKGTQENFMKPSGRFVSFYYHFFGDTSRQIANTFFGVQELVDSLVKVKQAGNGYPASGRDGSPASDRDGRAALARDSRAALNRDGRAALARDSSAAADRDCRIRAIYDSCFHFLYIAVNANHDFADVMDHVDVFVGEVFRLEYNQWRLYINYAYLNSFLEELSRTEYGESVQNLARTALQVYSLTFFMENILLIMERHVEGGITGRKKVHGLRGLSYFFNSVVFGGRRIFRGEMECGRFVLQYSDFLDKTKFLLDNGLGEGDSDFNRERKFNTELFYNFLDYPYTRKEVSLPGIWQYYRDSRFWLGETIERMTLVHGNFYLFGQEEAELCRLYGRNEPVFGYQAEMESEIRTVLMQCFEHVDMEAYADGEIKRVQESMKAGQSAGEIGMFQICKNTREWLEKETDDYCEMMDLLQYHAATIGKMDLAETLSCLPEEYENRIRDQLPLVLEHRELLAIVIRNLIQNIRMGDYLFRAFSVHSITEVQYDLKILSKIKQGRYRKRINQISEMLSGDSEDLFDTPEEEMNSGVVYMEEDVNQYAGIMTLLRNIAADLPEEGGTQDSGGQYLQAYRDLMEYIDRVIEIHSEEFEKAVQLSVMLQLLKNLVRLYVAITVKQKCGENDPLSASGLKKRRVVHRQEGERREDGQTFYYRLFEKMKEIAEGGVRVEDEVRDNAEPGAEEAVIKARIREMNEEFPVFKNFVRQRMQTAGKRYVRQLLNHIAEEDTDSSPYEAEAFLKEI